MSDMPYDTSDDPYGAGHLMSAIRDSITPPSDPQVKVFFVVECASDYCDAFDEGSPFGVTEIEALSKALSDDWNMVRADDGKLYCEGCTDRRHEVKACTAGGHAWNPWDKLPSHGGNWPAISVRSCDCGERHERIEEAR